MTKITVKQKPDDEVPVEVLANAIVAIAEGVKKLRSSRLTDRTLNMLIADAAPRYSNGQSVTMSEVKNVIAGIEGLAATHLKKVKS